MTRPSPGLGVRQYISGKVLAPHLGIRATHPSASESDSQLYLPSIRNKRCKNNRTFNCILIPCDSWKPLINTLHTVYFWSSSNSNQQQSMFVPSLLKAPLGYVMPITWAGRQQWIPFFRYEILPSLLSTTGSFSFLSTADQPPSLGIQNLTL